MAKTKSWADETANIVAELASYQNVLAEKSFTKRATFLDKYGSGWDGLKYWKQEIASPDTYFGGSHVVHPSDSVAPLDLEKAKPFVRAVIERMLDLLSSEENWIKGAVAQSAAGQQVDAHDPKAQKWCLIGAQARAVADLGLHQLQAEREVETQRKKVLKTVEVFLRDALADAKGYNSMPSFNDQHDTTFEDVRLWLKSCLGRLED